MKRAAGLILMVSTLLGPAQAAPLGSLEAKSVWAWNVFLAVSWPIAVLTASPVIAVLCAVIIPTLKRRTQAWARENDRWRAFKRFLDDFSDFRELPPEALTLWESYLVFGILFGNAKKILKALPVILGERGGTVPAWYSAAGRAGFVSSADSIASMAGSIGHIAATVSQVSLSAAHYSSGAGGGFSGGGGGAG